MDLWIRGQVNKKISMIDKGIGMVKANDIRIKQTDKYGFRALSNDEAIGWSLIVNDDHCVGTYATKERAVEVLDEIQRHLVIINDKDNNFYVYEMPEN